MSPTSRGSDLAQFLPLRGRRRRFVPLVREAAEVLFPVEGREKGLEGAPAPDVEGGAIEGPTELVGVPEGKLDHLEAVGLHELVMRSLVFLHHYRVRIDDEGVHRVSLIG